MVISQVASHSQERCTVSEKHKPLVDYVREHGKVALRNCEPDTFNPFHSRVVWSPLFEGFRSSNMYGLNRIPSGKFSSDGELPAGWKSAEQKICQLISGESDVKTPQGLIAFPSRRQYKSSSDEEHSVTTQRNAGSEHWKSGAGRKLYDDLSEVRESSSSDNSEVSQATRRRFSHRTASSSSSAPPTNNPVKESGDRPTQSGCSTGTSNGSFVCNEGNSLDSWRVRPTEGGHFTFTSRRANKGSAVSPTPLVASENFDGKLSGTCSTGSGGIGRGRIVRSHAGKENELPGYLKPEEGSHSYDTWEKLAVRAEGERRKDRKVRSKVRSSGDSSVGETADGFLVEKDDVRAVMVDSRSEEGVPETPTERPVSVASVSCSTLTDVEKNGVGWRSLPRSKNKKTRRRTRTHRSESPADVVACAASMIGDTVQAVRKVREEAAELAYQLAELHAKDADALRSAAVMMCQHVDQLQDEVQEFQDTWSTEEPSYPWKDLLREVLVTVSLISGALSVKTLLNALRRAAAQDGFWKQTVTRQEKMIFAAVVLTVGARFGNGLWKGLNETASSKESRQRKLAGQINAIAKRVNFLSAVSHTDPTVSALPVADVKL